MIRKTKKFSLDDFNNKDELDFSFKDLDDKELDAFCHAVTSWQIMTSYQLAEELLGSDDNFEDRKRKKNLQLKSLKKTFRRCVTLVTIELKIETPLVILEKSIPDQPF